MAGPVWESLSVWIPIIDDGCNHPVTSPQPYHSCGYAQPWSPSGLGQNPPLANGGYDYLRGYAQPRGPHPLFPPQDAQTLVEWHTNFPEVGWWEVCSVSEPGVPESDKNTASSEEKNYKKIIDGYGANECSQSPDTNLIEGGKGAIFS